MLPLSDIRCRVPVGSDERRWFTAAVRALPATEGVRKIVGHGAVFNQLSSDLGGFREQIAPGAFRESLEKQDCFALFNHSRDFVLGRSGAGTARFREDDQGLAYEIDTPDTTWARDLVVSIERGDISQSSFGFRVESEDDETWSVCEDGQVVRTLHRVRLFDAGPVTMAAYPQTDAAVRSASGAEMRALAQAQYRLSVRSPVAGDHDLIRAEIRALSELITEPWQLEAAKRQRMLDELRRGLEVTP